MALVWLSTIYFGLSSKFKGAAKKDLLIGIFILSLSYNGVFIEEYLFGRINGNASSLIRGVKNFISTNNDIKKVTVYNDTGGWDIQETGKYRKRLYIDPKFDIKEKVMTLNQYKEHYMVVNIPRIDPTTVYQKYFDTCIVVYEKIDQKISAKVYDCRYAPDLKI